MYADQGGTSAASRVLRDAAGTLSSATNVCTPAVDAGEHTGMVNALLGGLADAAAGLLVGLETGAAAAADHGRQVQDADAASRGTLDQVARGLRP